MLIVDAQIHHLVFALQERGILAPDRPEQDDEVVELLELIPDDCRTLEPFDHRMILASGRVLRLRERAFRHKKTHSARIG
jgi:hypothetical protein